MQEHTISRRDLLRGAAAVGTTALVGEALTGRATAQSGFDGWFDDVSNYDGVVDKTGQSEVTVTVGAEANGGGFGFGPAAVRVDPGTTVVWEWNGEGGSHNVVADDGSYESKMHGESGATFSHAFDSKGVSKYYCMPHKAMGMKGAIVVGDVDVGAAAGSSGSQSDQSGNGDSGDDGGSGSGGNEPDYGSWFDNVGNFDGTVDKTGQAEVTVQVGSQANGGGFGFAPPAIRVSPGTTVTWEWTGEGGSHNVVADDGSFESELVGEQGHTFSQTFESGGVTKYYCLPHKSMGMKGAVYVDGSATSSDTMQAPEPDSNPGGTEITLGELALVGSVVAGMLSPLAFGAFLGANGDGSEGQTGHRPE